MENGTTELLEELQTIADAFYQNQIKTGIEKLPDLVRKLSDFVSHLQPEQQPEFLKILEGVMEAMEIKNYIMLADMLVFDVMETIEGYQV